MPRPKAKARGRVAANFGVSNPVLSGRTGFKGLGLGGLGSVGDQCLGLRVRGFRGYGFREFRGLVFRGLGVQTCFKP